MSDDDLAYLSPGFDLGSLTVPRIRSILVSHDVSYPSSAKKAQLIEILQNEILPKSKKLLAARERTKRTSKGIVDVPSSQEGTVDGEQDAELMPPPPVPKTPRRRTKKSSTGPDASEDDLAPPPSTSRKSKTPGRRSTTKGVRASDTETDTNTDMARPSARKSRKSVKGEIAATPSRKSHVKIEESELDVKQEPIATDSPFSDDNPFQSGSPDPTNRRISSDGKRKSLGASSSRDPEKRRSTGTRRQTASPSLRPNGATSAPSRTTLEYPVSRLQGSEDAEPSEEFTPEEQLELVRERAAKGYSGKDLLPPRRKKQKPASTTGKALPWIVLTILLSSFGFWWRKEKIEIGYCGVGKPNWSLADTKVPQWANVMEPQCEPCPQHAYCFNNMKVECDSDYVLTPHPYSLFGTLPLPPTCEPDGEKARKVKAVADRAVEELRERRAQFECGELPDHEKPEIAEDDLKQELKAKRSKRMSDEEFDELWTAAIGDVVGREEVVSEGAGHTSIVPGSSSRRLTSTSLAKLGYVCAAKRRVRVTLSFYRLHLSLMILFVGLCVYARGVLRARSAATAQIPSLMSLTLDRLATQAGLKASGETEEGWISIGQLRDDVLREVLTASERERVWKGVRTVIEGNANVRAGTRESASGEWVRVWEWIGPVGRRQIEGARRSDAYLRDGSRSATSGSPEVKQEEMTERDWNERRPVF